MAGVGTGGSAPAGLGESEYVEFIPKATVFATAIANIRGTANRPTNVYLNGPTATTQGGSANRFNAMSLSTNSFVNSLSNANNRTAQSSSIINRSLSLRTRDQIVRPSDQITRQRDSVKRRDDVTTDPPNLPPRLSDPQSIAKSKALLRRIKGRTLDMPRSTGNDVTNTNLRRRSDISSNNKIVVATHDFVPVAKDDLPLQKGDLLEILRGGHLWWYAKNMRTGNVGYVPSNHIKQEDKESNPLLLPRRRSELLPPSGRNLVKALEDYSSGSAEEISFREGDILVVLNDTSKWWYARHLKTGQEGFIPRVYVRAYAEDEEEDGDEENTSL